MVTLALTAALCIGATAAGAYHGVSDSNTSWSAMGSSGQSYTYSQYGYYQGPYIFELGWNLNEKACDAYADKADIELSDLTTMSVSFDPSCKSEARNQLVLAELEKMVERLKVQYSNSDTPLEKPLVVSVEYVGDNELVELAAKYYADSDLTKFSAVFSSLDKDIQKEYCADMIENEQNALLSSAAGNMEEDIIDFCAEKTYEDGKIALFTGICPYFSDAQKQAWIARASQDGKNTFLAVLTR